MRQQVANWAIGVAPLVVLFLASSCAGGGGTLANHAGSGDGLVLPRLSDAREIALTGRIEGALISSGGCLALQSESGELTTLLWPSTARLIGSDEMLQVRDSLTGSEVGIGEYVVLPGGTFESLPNEAYAQRPLSSCMPPYFIVESGTWTKSRS